jgi:hypothetical protein
VVLDEDESPEDQASLDVSLSKDREPGGRSRDGWLRNRAQDLFEWVEEE